MRRHVPVMVLVAAFVALAALYNAVTPLGEAPDEPGHGQYVLFLAREGRLPVQCAAPCQSDVPGSGHHPPLAYLLATLPVGWLPPEERRIDLPGNQRFTWAGGDQPNAVGHGTREHWPWQGPVLAWHLARLASTLAGAATVVLTYLAARALQAGAWIADSGPGSGHAGSQELSSPLPLLAAALVALSPQFVFTSAVISNDALLAALGAALLWLAVGERPGADDRGGPRRPVAAVLRRLGRPAAVGLALGLALITKQSAVVLVPVALGWAALGPGAARAGGTGARAAWRTLAVCAVAAAVSGWWYARNWRLYGDAMGFDLFHAEFATQPFDPLRPDAWAGALAQLYASLWARFGWLNVAPPTWVDGIYALLGAAACVGLALGRPGTAARAPGSGGARPPLAARLRPLARAAWPVALTPTLALGWVLSFALAAGLVAWQGRLLFPAASAIAILLAWGLTNVALRVRRPGPWGGGAARYALCGALGALALWLPLGVIRPAYPMVALPERAALERLGTPVFGRFARDDEPGAELRGYAHAGQGRAGEALALDLMWHARGRQNRDWWVFVHLVDAEGRIAAETNAEVGGGRFPMLQWTAGDWVPDRHTLALPATLAPGRYELRLGLWFPRTERRAKLYDEDGDLAGDQLVLGTVTVGR